MPHEINTRQKLEEFCKFPKGKIDACNEMGDFYDLSIIVPAYNVEQYILNMDMQRCRIRFGRQYIQLGIIGIILYVYSLYLCYKKITHTNTASDRQKLSCVYIYLYLILCTLSEATFINWTGVIAAVIIAFLLNAND